MGIKGKELIIIERKTFNNEDEYGNPTIGVEQILVPNCLVAWGNSSEDTDLFGATVETSATLQLPNNTPTQKSDVFILPNDERYVQTGKGVQWVGQKGNPVRMPKLVNVILKEGSSNG